MIDNSKEYILCAAILYDDGITHQENSCPKTGTGVVITGHRHYNCISLMPTGKDYLKNFPEKNILKMDDFVAIQGFMTSRGRFVDRKEGMMLAFIAQQVTFRRAVKAVEADEDDFWKKIDEEIESGKDKEWSGAQRAIIADNVTEWNTLYSEDLY